MSFRKNEFPTNFGEFSFKTLVVIHYVIYHWLFYIFIKKYNIALTDVD